MCCASLSPAEFASTEGISQPSAIKPYYPTGDPEQGKNISFTTAMNCCDALKALHSGNDAASVANKYLELSQALSDLGLLHSASTTSGFALETFQSLHTAAPDKFSLSVASVLSLRATISADLKKFEDAVKVADEAVALCQDNGSDPTSEVAYALLNCAVLLCSVGRKERGAAVALTLVKLLGDANDSQFDTIHISSLCRLCISDAHVGVDSALALSTAEELIEASRNSSVVAPQAVLAGALFTKSKVLSAQNQYHLAHVASAEAITLLRAISAERPVFSLILAHALDTHSQQLLSADQIADSYSAAKEAVELWRSLMMAAPALISPFRRPLGWALVHQAKFRPKSNRRKAIREELDLAQFAVMIFRLVTPLDGAGLATALYIVADRMRELDESRDAAPLAEEAVTRLQELSSEAPDTYSLDLIFSLSLASSCLAGTERANDALKYAKDAVDEQRDREDEGDAQYDTHLRQLLRDVVLRLTEMGRQEEAQPWFEEMKSLGQTGEISESSLPGQGMGRLNDDASGELTTAYRSRARGRGRDDGEIRKKTVYWIDGANGQTSPSQG
jgi:tetratricopeptide (TPR) repeat protein